MNRNFVFSLILTLLSIFGFILLLVNIHGAFYEPMQIIYSDALDTTYVRYDYFGFSSFKLMFDDFMNDSKVQYFLDFENIIEWLQIPTSAVSGDFLTAIVVLLVLPYYVIAPAVYLVCMLFVFIARFAVILFNAFGGAYNLTRFYEYKDIPTLIHN